MNDLKPATLPPAPIGRVFRVALFLLCVLTGLLFLGFVEAAPAFQRMLASFGDLPTVTTVVLDLSSPIRVPIGIAWAVQVTLTAGALVTKAKRVAQGALAVALLNLLWGTGLLGACYLPLVLMSTSV
jgi:hypothetical protein